MGDAPCSFMPRRRGVVLWRRLGLGRRRKLQIARLGGGRAGGGRCRGLLRRLRQLRWLRSAVRKLAAIYMAALSGPPSSCPAWVGVEPCFATPFVFVPNARPFL